MKKNSYHIGEVARLLGVRYYRIQYAHRTLALPEPAKFHNVRTYFAADVRRAAAYFGVPAPSGFEDRPGGSIDHDERDIEGREAEDGPSPIS